MPIPLRHYQTTSGPRPRFPSVNWQTGQQTGWHTRNKVSRRLKDLVNVLHSTGPFTKVIALPVLCESPLRAKTLLTCPTDMHHCS